RPAARTGAATSRILALSSGRPWPVKAEVQTTSSGPKRLSLDAGLKPGATALGASPDAGLKPGPTARAGLKPGATAETEFTAGRTTRSKSGGVTRRGRSHLLQATSRGPSGRIF